jgi:8-oxo-dGTP diphosphatase
LASLKVGVWRMLSGILQWYVLWLAHAKFIVGVSGVILNKQDQVLLLRHRYWRKGTWELPSGYMNRGEKLENALVREAKEETGYDVQVGALLRVVSGYKLRVEASYMGWLVGGDLAVDPGEVLEARFFSLSELPAGLLDSHRELVQLACERGQILTAR